ncbi:MAG: ATP-binding cassette domain-containing protein [Eubacteriales bacterium]
MNDKKRIHRNIYADCIRAVTLPTLLYGAQACLEGILAVLTAGILGQFADAVFQLDFTFGLSNLWKLLACVGVTVLVMPVLSYICNYFAILTSVLHERMIFGRFLDKEYASVLQYDAGDIRKRLEWDSVDMRCNFESIVSDSAKAAVTLAYLLYSTFSLSPVYTLLVLAISVLRLTVPAAVRKLEQKYDRQTREYRSKVSSYEEELVRQPHTVKQYGLSAALLGRLDAAYKAYFRDVQAKSIRCSRVAGGISSFLEAFCTFAVLLSGAVLAARGDITPGTVAAMMGYFGVFGTVMGTIGGVIRMVPKLTNSVERMELFYEREERTSGREPGDVREIQADGLSFTYEGQDRAALKKLSFRIQLTGTTAICGANGSGKSTLLRILGGLLGPWDGRLLLNGAEQAELSEVSPAKWRERLAYAPQDPYLFTGTVRENVHLGNPAATDAEVDAVLAELGLEALSSRVIRAGSGELSGGEKQKISLARAFLKNAPILLLDEPFNHLDAHASVWLERVLLSHARCVLYITHAPSPSADEVLRIGS